MRELINYIWNMSASEFLLCLAILLAAILIPIIIIQVSVWRRFRQHDKDFNEMRDRVRSRLRQK